MEKKYDYILFDLDGTLTDSKEGIINSVSYALEKMKEELPSIELLESFIGPPLLASFINVLGFSEEKAREAIRLQRVYFQEKGIYENKVYAGIEELLIRLKNQGFDLNVATSKPTTFAEIILEYFNLSNYFNVVVGSNLDGTRTDKGEVIAHTLELLHIKTPKKVLMVGDRKHDVEGALTNGLDVIGVTYGYGSIEELQKVKATFIAESVLDIEKFLYE